MGPVGAFGSPCVCGLGGRGGRGGGGRRGGEGAPGRGGKGEGGGGRLWGGEGLWADPPKKEKVILDFFFKNFVNFFCCKIISVRKIGKKLGGHFRPRGKF